jgi:hypothetical protein
MPTARNRIDPPEHALEVGAGERPLERAARSGPLAWPTSRSRPATRRCAPKNLPRERVREIRDEIDHHLHELVAQLEEQDT